MPRIRQGKRNRKKNKRKGAALQYKVLAISSNKNEVDLGLVSGDTALCIAYLIRDNKESTAAGKQKK